MGGEDDSISAPQRFKHLSPPSAGIFNSPLFRVPHSFEHSLDSDSGSLKGPSGFARSSTEFADHESITGT